MEPFYSTTVGGRHVMNVTVSICVCLCYKPWNHSPQVIAVRVTIKAAQNYDIIVVS